MDTDTMTRPPEQDGDHSEDIDTARDMAKLSEVAQTEQSPQSDQVIDWEANLDDKEKLELESARQEAMAPYLKLAETTKQVVASMTASGKARPVALLPTGEDPILMLHQEIAYWENKAGIAAAEAANLFKRNLDLEAILKHYE